MQQDDGKTILERVMVYLDGRFRAEEASFDAYCAFLLVRQSYFNFDGVEVY